ncbi:VOC family protein [Microbulbifer yueqingensis]|uniref:Catechol 2,3-dioxygenase n=1 Tax=Microbulbifer yueqingensis TaxID=658219 RepID=A0A1G8Z9L3_9GAMM|nr:VOC family protein [Microbulbifer yueqingensis]SDK10870.1 Catechol 2,3-dioxygenase [Microbulbifer yueqingensis]
MISHLTLGTNNLDASVKYYDQILGLLDAKQVAKTSDVVFYKFPNSDTKLAIANPYNGDYATYGNGTMVALKVASEEAVRDVYQLAIRLNSKCEGPPGPRGNGAYFAAYFRDLDGNKLVVFHRNDDENPLRAY